MASDFTDGLGVPISAIDVDYKFDNTVDGIALAWLYNLKSKGIPDKLLAKGVVSGGGQASDLAADANIIITEVNTGNSWTLSMKDYWKYVESGRGIGRPAPPSAIAYWIKKKGISPADVLQKMKPQSKRLPFEKALTSLSFIIARSIGKKGTIKRFGYSGSKFLTEVLNEQVPVLKAALEEKLSRNITIRVVTDLKGLTP
mgnify:FL=1